MGNMLNDFERQSAAKQIAMLTGLSEDFVSGAPTRVSRPAASGANSRAISNSSWVAWIRLLLLRPKRWPRARGAGGGGRGGRGGNGDPSMFTEIFAGGNFRGYVPNSLGFKTDTNYQMAPHLCSLGATGELEPTVTLMSARVAASSVGKATNRCACVLVASGVL